MNNCSRDVFAFVSGHFLPCTVSHGEERQGSRSRVYVTRIEIARPRLDIVVQPILLQLVPFLVGPCDGDSTFDMSRPLSSAHVAQGMQEYIISYATSDIAGYISILPYD